MTMIGAARARRLATAAIAAFALTAGSAAAGRPAPVTLSATPDRLEIFPLPCLTGTIEAAMTNGGDEPVYADAFITAEQPLEASRTMFSSYLPPGYTAVAPIELWAPREAPAGEYELRIESGRAVLDVPVTVLQPPPKGPGDNLAFGEQASASSTHGNFDVCGGVDGNADSEDWDVRTGWNDATRSQFPDTYQVALAGPARVDRVELYTLDSARWPAARYGLRDWDVLMLAGGEWRAVAQVRGNTSGHVTTTFDAVTAEAVRIVALGSNDGAYSRIVELEVYGG
jgi:F5/8 type C domain